MIYPKIAAGIPVLGEGNFLRNEDRRSSHFVQFYEDDAFMIRSCGAFIGGALGAGEAALVITTPEHREGIESRLADQGIEVVATKNRGQLVFIDAATMLASLMDGGELPNRERFEENIGAIVSDLRQKFGGLRAFGEMVSLLCAAGNSSAAIRLEQFWSELGERYNFSLLCGYALRSFTEPGSEETFRQICSQHSHVRPAESFPERSFIADDQLRSIAQLQQKAGSLEREITHRRLVEDELREQARSLDILHRVACALVVEQELSSVVQLVTDAGRELSGAQFGAFFYNVNDEKGESYMLYTLSGVPAEAFSKFPMPRNTAIFAPTFEGSGVVRLGDVTKDPRYGLNSPHQGMPEGHLPVRSYLAVPVASSNGVVHGGLFFGHATPDKFTDKAEQMLVALAAQAAVAIDNTMLTAALQREFEAVRLSEERSRTLAAIVESSEDAIIGKTLEGVIKSWNAGAERMFGYVESEVVGKPVTILFPENHINEEAIILAKIRSGKRVEHYETVRRRKDGSLIDIALTVSPIRNADGQIIGASKIVRDISARKRDEAALKEVTAALARANEELEERVSDRTSSLQEAIAQMEEFSYTVSHDLRAPLRAMKVYSNVLLEDFGDLLAPEPEAQKCVSRIAENCSRLDKMIHDVLAYGRIAREKLDIHPVSLDSLVADTLQNYPALQFPNAEIDVEPLGTVVGHEPSLTQILSNLLNNAVKFVRPGVRPKVKVWTEESDQSITLWIEDNGIGIAPNFQHRLFTMFERIHPEGGYEGTGVGLAIVRKATERMGGDVGVVSDGTNGSRFWVKLPKAI